MARSQDILKNNRFLWLDGTCKQNDDDTLHTLTQLRAVIPHLNLFTNIDDCIEYLNEIKHEKVLIITSGSLGQHVMEYIHHLLQVDIIYIFCRNPNQHKVWTGLWSKIKGVYDEIEPICEALETMVTQNDTEISSTNIFNLIENGEEESRVNLNRLSPSFMYTTLLKRIILSMEHTSDEKQAIIKFCRKHYADNPRELKIVDEFDRDYQPDKAIWWYTRECFTYQILNQALRSLKPDIIVDMGFFIYDLHRQLEQLHQEQFFGYHGPPLTVFRGQALSIEEFNDLQQNQGGLLAFNSFLSTSKIESVSLEFAQQNSSRDKTMLIIFVMTINPAIGSGIFAYVNEHSYLANEDEVLFSMHTVFRIGNIVMSSDGQHLFTVPLILTSDNDSELSQLTDRIEEEIGEGTGCERLEQILLNLEQWNKAEQLHLTLSEHTSRKDDQGRHYHILGLIKDKQGDYQQAIKYYQRAISIRKMTNSPIDSNLAACYHNMGMVYSNMGKKFLQALFFYNKAIAIQEKILPSNHHHLTITFNSIGRVYLSMGQYDQALYYCKKSLDIQEKILPTNHPDLASSYNNIGMVHKYKQKYSKQLFYLKKALTIQEKTLLTNHPDLVASYNNMGAAYYQLKDYSKAKLYFEKALDQSRCPLSPDHPHLQTAQKWLEHVTKKLYK